MLRLHIAVHGRPANASPGRPRELFGQTLATLLPEHSLSAAPLPLSFEEAHQRLTSLPRLYAEPDGSFGWFSRPDDPRWEIGGMLYDRGDCVMYAEIEGCCPGPQWDQLLAALGEDRAPLIIQLVEQGVFLEPAEFRRLLVIRT